MKTNTLVYSQTIRRPLRALFARIVPLVAALALGAGSAHADEPDPLVNIAADYTVTTTATEIIVTRDTGTGSALTLARRVAGNTIRFEAGGSTFSVNGGAAKLDDSGDILLDGVTQLTVNAGAGDDSVSVRSFSGLFPSLAINGGTGNDTVSFIGDIAFAPNASLNVDMQDDSAVPGFDDISVRAGTNFTFSGTGGVRLAASKRVEVSVGASLQTEGGDIVIEANLQPLPTSGALHGAFIAGLVESTGSGNVTVSARGGNDPDTDRIGVYLTNAAAAIRTNTGNLTVVGTGGGAGLSNSCYGVYVVNGSIASIGGGTVNITGTGGNIGGTRGEHVGVHLLNGSVSSSGGDVVVTGIGGGSATTSLNHGVQLRGTSSISTVGVGNITVSGTGGGGNGNNHGIRLVEKSTISSVDGSIAMTGVAADGKATSQGFRLSDIFNPGGTIATTGTGSITVNADTASILEGGAITSASAPVTMTPITAGWAIDLGSAVDGTANTLGLSNTELALISAGTLNIGGAGGGAITVSAIISPVSFRTLSLGSNTNFTATGGLALDIASATDFEKVLVNGDVQIVAGASLSVNAGAFVPGPADRFVLVANLGPNPVAGSFTAFAEGVIVSLNGVDKQITYVGGTGNDVVLGPPVFLPTVVEIAATAVTAVSANVGCNVTADGGAPILRRGVVFSKVADNPDPRIGGADVLISEDSAPGTGIVTFTVTNLDPESDYVFRAFASNSAGVAYSATGLFTTLEVVPVTQGNSYSGLLTDSSGKVRGSFRALLGPTGFGSIVVWADGRLAGSKVLGETSLTLVVGGVPMLVSFPAGPMTNAGHPTLRVTVNNGTENLTGTIVRSPYEVRRRTVNSGKYTFAATALVGALPTDPVVGAVMTGTITRYGGVRITARLGNGRVATFGSQELGTGEIPVYVGNTNGGTQSLSGTLVVSSLTAPQINGLLRWKVPAGADVRMPAGVDANYGTIGARYTPGLVGSLLTLAPSKQIKFALEIPSLSPISRDYTLAMTTSVIQFADTRPFSRLQFLAATGLFTGTTSYDSVRRNFSGVLLQGASLNYGIGFIEDTAGLGPVGITPVR